MKKFSTLLIAILSVALLSSCAGRGETPSFPDGVVCTYNGAMYTITGYDAAAVTYTPFGDGGQLYLANPKFLGPSFEGAVVEGSAALYDGIVKIGFTLAASDDGTVTGPQALFSVDLDAKAVTKSEFIEWNGETFTLTNDEMLSIGRTLGDILLAADAHHKSAQ